MTFDFPLKQTISLVYSRNKGGFTFNDEIGEEDLGDSAWRAVGEVWNDVFGGVHFFFSFLISFSCFIFFFFFFYFKDWKSRREIEARGK